MATHSDLSSLFVDIADAIRTKKGTTDTIVANNFPEEIATIETGFAFELGETMTPAEFITGSYTVLNSYEKCIVIFASVRNYDSTSAVIIRRNGVDIPVVFTRDFRYTASVNISAVYGMSEIISLSAGDTIYYSYNNRNNAENVLSIIRIKNA